MKNNLKAIMRDCRAAMRPVLAWQLAGDLFGGLISVMTAHILGSFADAVFSLDLSVCTGALWKLAVSLFATVFIVPLFQLLSDFCMLKKALEHDRLVMGHFLDLQYAATRRYEYGDIEHRMLWDATDLRIFYVVSHSLTVSVPVTLALLLASALPQNPLFTAVCFTAALTRLALPVAMKKREAKYDLATRAYRSDRSALEAGITSLPCETVLFDLTENRLSAVDACFRAAYRETICRQITLHRLTAGITALLDPLLTVFLLVTGALFVSRGAAAPGTVAAMIGYFAVFQAQFENFGRMFSFRKKLRNCAERLLPFYEEAECSTGADPGSFQTISANNLCFSYGEKSVITDLSFTVRKGEKVAVTGPNGSGKSTLIKLICGLYAKTGGSLTVNGREIDSLSRAAWYANIAYAPQEPILFSGTVRENVRIGAPGGDENTLEAILQATGLGSLADRMISPAENQLSGGEKQKISIARALFKNAPLLLLDEPHNNLDAATQAWLDAFIRDYHGTLLFITHDEPSCRHADSIIALS